MTNRLNQVLSVVLLTAALLVGQKAAADSDITNGGQHYTIFDTEGYYTATAGSETPTVYTYEYLVDNVIVPSYSGLPYQYTYWMTDRNCKFTECLSYYDGKELKQFMGKHSGTLATEVLGNDTDKKWSDLWYIYKPQGYDKTLAEMTDEERKNRNRFDDVDSWTEFANWYKTEDK